MTLRTGSDRRRRRHRGLALIEVMVTVTILFVGIFSILRAFTTAVRAMEIADETLAADALLREKMAAIDLQTRLQGGMAGLPGVPWTSAERTYRWALSVKRVPGLGAEGLTEVRIEAAGRNGERRYSLTSWFRDRPATAPGE